MCIKVAPLAMGSGGFLVALWSDGNQETEIPNMVMEGPPKKEAAKKEPAKKKTPKKEPAKKEPAKKETPKKEAPKKEPAKKEAPKKEAPKKEPAKKEAPKKKANTKRKLGAECAEGDQEAQKAQNAKEAKKNAPEGAGGRSDQLKDIIATLSSRAGFKVTMVNGTEQSYLLGKLGAKQKLVIPCGRSMARDLFFETRVSDGNTVFENQVSGHRLQAMTKHSLVIACVAAELSSALDIAHDNYEELRRAALEVRGKLLAEHKPP